MKKILLPELVRIDKAGRNVIKHKLFKGGSFESASVEVNDNYLLQKNDNGEPLCIVQKNKPYPQGLSRVIVVDKKPTVDNFFNPSLSPKWLKYPDLTEATSPDSVCESWKNTFTYKEEDLPNDILGLRKPQIAAIFNVLTRFYIYSGVAGSDFTLSANGFDQ